MRHCTVNHLAFILAYVFENQQFGFPTRSITNQTVESYRNTRSLQFGIEVEEELYYPSSKKQLLHSWSASLVSHYADCWFSSAAAHLASELHYHCSHCYSLRFVYYFVGLLFLYQI